MNTDTEESSSDGRTQLEHLPSEMIDHIFEYLPGDLVYRSFYPLNRHFKALVQHSRLTTIDSSAWSRQDIIDFFKCFYDDILPYLLSLQLSNRVVQSDHCSANIELVFSLCLDRDQVNHLCDNLEQLILIRPIIDTTLCLPDVILRSFMIYPTHDRIICRKTASRMSIHDLTICDVATMRSLLAGNGGTCDQMLVYYQNPKLDTITPFVRHLKIRIDHQKQPWGHLSQLIVSSLSDLTLVILDGLFEHCNGEMLYSLLPDVSIDCRLHFYIDVSPRAMTGDQLDAHALRQSFQNDFYVQHQSSVVVSHAAEYFSGLRTERLRIYTSPCCASVLALMNPESIMDVGSNFEGITRLVLNLNATPNTNAASANLLPHVVALELLHASPPRLRHWSFVLNALFQQTASQMRHIHVSSVECLEYLLLKTVRFSTLPALRYLDITYTWQCDSSFDRILRESRPIRDILHLKMSGSAGLGTNAVEAISKHFLKLQTLQFPMQLTPSFMERLTKVGQYILVHMRSHLKYVHIHFQEEDSTAVSSAPSEMQLSEWLGKNHRRLAHVQAIELTRNQLSAWL